MDIALTRDVSPAIARCELTFLERRPIDYPRAAVQHREYCDRLESLGLEVIRLPADEACPDGCFVEDAAVVLDEIAVLTMMGSPGRRAESLAIEGALRLHRRIVRLELPATLDGGDVLLLRRTLYVGASARTNAHGIAALRETVRPFGYEVVPVAVGGCLHLKSAVTALDDETLVANPAWLDKAPFAKLRIVSVAPEEPGAANVLRVRGQVWAHPGFPRTMDRIERAGFRVTPVDVSEFVKAEAALTCKSVLFRRRL